MINITDFIYEKLVIGNNLDNFENKDPNNPTTWEEGDILAGTWGYSMIIPAFYKIVKKTPAGFNVVELSKKVVKGSYNGQFEEVPDDSKLEKDLKGKVIRCRIKKGNYVKVDNKVFVHLWDGKPVWGDDMD